MTAQQKDFIIIETRNESHNDIYWEHSKEVTHIEFKWTKLVKNKTYKLTQLARPLYQFSTKEMKEINAVATTQRRESNAEIDSIKTKRESEWSLVVQQNYIKLTWFKMRTSFRWSALFFFLLFFRCGNSGDGSYKGTKTFVTWRLSKNYACWKLVSDTMKENIGCLLH